MLNLNWLRNKKNRQDQINSKTQNASSVPVSNKGPVASAEDAGRKLLYQYRYFWHSLGLILIGLVVGLGVGWQWSKHVNQGSLQDSVAKQAKALTSKLVAIDSQLPTDTSDQKTKDYVATAKSRYELMQKLASTQPTAVLALANPYGFANAPDDAQQYLEKPAIANGTLDAVHGEQFDKDGKVVSGTEVTDYYIQSGNDKNRLYATEEISGSHFQKTISVNAIKLGDSYVADTAAISETSQPNNTTPVLGASTTKKVAVVLVNFKNNTAQPYTADQARQAYFTGVAGNPIYSVNNFYQVSSDNQVGLAGDVFGYYTIPYDNGPSCNYTTWSNAADSMASAAGVNLSSYDYVSYLWPPAPNCANYGELGGRHSWIDGSVSPAVIEHELGHNFGAHHSNTYTCTNGSGQAVSLSSSCTTHEYADPFDVMGNGSGMGNTFNNIHRTDMGFSMPTQTVTTSGTYTLAALESSSGSPRMIRIPRSDGSAFALEFRRATPPYDNFNNNPNFSLDGVLVRIQSKYRGAQSQLLDMTPGSLNGSYYGFDNALTVGQTFTDPFTNMTIKTTAVNSSAATVAITFSGGGAAPPPSCTPNTPSAAVSPTGQWGNPGQTLNYNLTLTNNDSSACSSASFNISSLVPPGFSQSPATSSISLAPGASTSINFSVTSPSSAVSGSYNNFTENIAHGSLSASASGSYNVNTVTPPPSGGGGGTSGGGGTGSGSGGSGGGGTTNSIIKFVKTVASGSRSSSGNSSLSMTVPSGSSAAAGDRLIISAAVSTRKLTPTCKDSQGNSYSIDAVSPTNQIFVCSSQLAKALNPGDTITLTYAGFSGYTSAMANEFSGVASTNALDGVSYGANSSTKSVTVSPALNTNNDNDLLFGVIFAKGFAANSDFSLISTTSTPYAIYKLTTSKGSFSALGNEINPAAWRSLLVAYKAQ